MQRTFFRILSFGTLVALAACADAEQPAVDAPPTPVEAPVAPAGPLRDPARVDLSREEARPIPGLGGTVTLVSARSSAMVGPGGRRLDVTRGTLRFERGGEAQEVAFTTGQTFEQYGHPMTVQGEHGFHTLTVFPPGEAP